MQIPINISDAFFPLLFSRKRYKRLQGGGGSGKSIAVAKIVLIRTLSKEGQRAFCFRKVGATVKDSLFATFKDLIYEHGLDDYFIINKSSYSFICENGSEINCRGLDEPEKIKSIKDPTLIWMEEATEFTEADFLQLDLRLRKGNTHLEFYLSYNPISKNNWVYQSFESDNTYKSEEHYLKTTWRDNPYLPPEYVKMLQRLQRKSENHYKVYALGEWGEIVKGLIFPDYEIVDSMPDGEYIYGLDFGFVDPMTIIRILIQDPDVYWEQLYFKTGQTIPGMLQDIPSLGISKKDRIYYDSARPGDGQQIYNAGYRGAKPAQKGPGSIAARINKMKSYNMKIVAGSTDLIDEVNKYRWDEDREGNLIEGKPIDAFNHCIDGGGYAIYTHTYKPQLKSPKVSPRYKVQPHYKR